MSFAPNRLQTALILALAGLLALLVAMPPRQAETPANTAAATRAGGVGPASVPRDYIWIARSRLLSLPMDGPAWANVMAAARRPVSPPDLSDQDDPANVHVLARALVHARTGDAEQRDTVIGACMLAIGTEGGRTLALGKELIAYILAADLVGLPQAEDQRFRAWLADLRHREFPSGKTLVSTHQDRPNNWGTYAGAGLAAIAAYLDEPDELQRIARIFKGWLGDRDSYAGFTYKSPGWQADPARPVGINPAGATKNGFAIDGVLPDDQRRGGDFQWPPPRENYVYTALQGALATAIILDRAGYPVWEWEDRALLRAFQWLHEQAAYPARGDDGWQPHVINYYYGADFPAPVPAEPGKNVGWTDWTHGAAPAPQREGGRHDGR